MSVETEDKKLEQVVLRIVRDIDPEGIFLFGSQARGDAAPSSDYDIALIFSSKEQVRTGLQRVHRLLWPRPFPVDLIGLTKECFHNGHTALARQVLKEGRSLYRKNEH